MASCIRRVLGEKDINVPVAPPPVAAKQRAVYSATGIQATPPVSSVPGRDASNTLAPHDVRGLAVHESTPAQSAYHTDQSSSQQQLMATTTPGASPIPTVGVAKSEVTTGTKRPRSVDDGASDQDQPIARSSQRQRLASPFSEDADTITVQSQPTLLTEERVAALQQQEPVVRSISASPTLVDHTLEPSPADLLRTRLRYALYKVRTDQTTEPLSRLEISTPSPRPRNQLLIQDVPEELQKAFRASNGRPWAYKHAKMKHARRIANIDPRLSEQDNDATQHTPVLAQPLLSLQTDHEKEEEPLPTTEDTPATPVSVSDCGSCSEGEDDEMKPQPLQRRYGPIMAQENDLTSSAVKDRAADSLLQLGGDRL